MTLDLVKGTNTLEVDSQTITDKNQTQCSFDLSANPDIEEYYRGAQAKVTIELTDTLNDARYPVPPAISFL